MSAIGVMRTPKQGASPSMDLQTTPISARTSISDASPSTGFTTPTNRTITGFTTPATVLDEDIDMVEKTENTTRWRNAGNAAHAILAFHAPEDREAADILRWMRCDTRMLDDEPISADPTKRMIFPFVPKTATVAMTGVEHDHTGDTTDDEANPILREAAGILQSGKKSATRRKAKAGAKKAAESTSATKEKTAKSAVKTAIAIKRPGPSLIITMKMKPKGEDHSHPSPSPVKKAKIEKPATPSRKVTGKATPVRKGQKKVTPSPKAAKESVDPPVTAKKTKVAVATKPLSAQAAKKPRASKVSPGPSPMQLRERRKKTLANDTQGES